MSLKTGVPAKTTLTWRQGLFELLSLLLVCDDQGVQVPAAAHLELHIVPVLLDFYSCRFWGRTVCIIHRELRSPVKQNLTSSIAFQLLKISKMSFIIASIVP